MPHDRGDQRSNTFHPRHATRRPILWLAGLDILHGGGTSSFTSFRAGTGYLNLIAQPEQQRWSLWGRIIFYVADVDAFYDRALAAGCSRRRCPAMLNGENATFTSPTPTDTSSASHGPCGLRRNWIAATELLRCGACHRARIRATRWLLAMTGDQDLILRSRVFAAVSKDRAGPPRPSRRARAPLLVLKTSGRLEGVPQGMTRPG